MYRLTRDDGSQILINGSIWESLLEIAYVYGWRPAGTEAPRTSAWLQRRTVSRGLVWDRSDYFSHESQHVGHNDAHDLSGAVARALRAIPDRVEAQEADTYAVPAGASCIPSRASASADGLSPHRRNVMRRFATFAGSGGFTISGGGDAD